MDFTLTDEQQAIADLAAPHPVGAAPAGAPPRARADRRRGSPTTCGPSSAKADLLGIALPEADGGGGYGILEACLIAEQVGRTVAPVPYLSSIVASAMPIAQFGSDAQRKQLLPGRHRGRRHAHRSRSTSPPTSPCRPSPPPRPPPTATGGGSTARSRS